MKTNSKSVVEPGKAAPSGKISPSFSLVDPLLTLPQMSDSHGNAQPSERFVAFTFASAEMVVEVDDNWTILFAAGAFQTKFDRPPETFVGKSIFELVAPIDHEAAERALRMLLQRGRLLPMVVRLADTAHSSFALGGIAIGTRFGTVRLCLSLARLPKQVADHRRLNTAQALARVSEARLDLAGTCNLGLLQIMGKEGEVTSSPGIVDELERVLPNAFASELAPGRFGVLSTGADLTEVANLLEATLQTQGVEVSVTSSSLALDRGGLTRTQATRALRQALHVYGKNGAAGLAGAGFGGGLAGFIKRAGAQARNLRRAIQERRFGFAFQPIVSLEDRSISHYEALIRPRDIPEFAGITPQEFVLLAEALELAPELDIVVARAACEAASQARTPIAFNVSAQSLQLETFRDQLFDLLRSNFARKDGLIKIEMTETAEVEDLVVAAQAVDMLRSIHVPFCLDDFGTGAADIRLLRALRADIVKLDGSYMCGMSQNGRERAFMSGMTEMARAAGAEVVAEQIETEIEADAVRGAGVKYGQGWLFGRPGALPERREMVHRLTYRRGL